MAQRPQRSWSCPVAVLRTKCWRGRPVPAATVVCKDGFHRDPVLSAANFAQVVSAGRLCDLGSCRITMCNNNPPKS